MCVSNRKRATIQKGSFTMYVYVCLTGREPPSWWGSFTMYVCVYLTGREPPSKGGSFTMYVCVCLTGREPPFRGGPSLCMCVSNRKRDTIQRGVLHYVCMRVSNRKRATIQRGVLHYVCICVSNKKRATIQRGSFTMYVYVCLTGREPPSRGGPSLCMYVCV